MSKRESIIRLSLIIRKLRAKPSSFEEILHFLETESEIQAYDFSISKRTFQRDIQDIASIFSIEIAFDSKKQHYYIAEQYEVTERLLEAFDTFSALNTQEKMTGVLYFENRKPLGLGFMQGFIRAIKQRKQVTFYYQKYWEEGWRKRCVHPYALKEFKQRWYLVGHDVDAQAIRIFGLDRIRELHSGPQTFPATDFDPEKYFQHCFGIIRPDEEEAQPQEVILSFNPFKGKYIKSLPLHSSQRILLDNEEETRVALTVYLTHDFKMEILSHGQEVKVLAPESFVKTISAELALAHNYY